MLKLAIVGAGKMATSHARVAAETSEVEITFIADTDEVRAQQLAAAHDCAWTTDIDQIEGVDLAVVASATPSHEHCAVALLGRGVPTLVEKPLAHDLAAVARIIEAAVAGDAPLMCGFVERFNPIVMAAQRLIDDRLIHFHAVRHSPVVERIRTSVVHDLLIHDADLAVRFAGTSAQHVSSSTWPIGSSDSVELADTVVQFESTMVANLSASRAGQRKVREIRLTTPTVLVELDLLRQDITVYRNVRFEEVVGDTTTYRENTMIDIPFVRHGGEPLALQFRHFLALARGDVDVAAERASLLEPHRIVSMVAEGATIPPAPGSGSGS